MLNKIWFWLVVIGILYAPLKSVVRPLLPLPAVEAVVTEKGETPTPPATFSDLGKTITQSAIDGANVAVDLLLSLIGIMVLWLGLMQVAKDAGLVDGLAYLLRPLMRWLFPDVPEGHPAQGAMLMNISANMLGLDNAATPFGLKAMQDLQELNPDPKKETTTDAMAMFLAINSSSVTIIPIAIIGYRIAAKSENPAGPLAYIMIATAVSTIVAVFTARMMSKLPRYALKPAAIVPQEEAAL
jgi:spore maturation protein A